MNPAASFEVTPDIILNENELQFVFVRASGPGGQNMNKVSTAVQLRYDVRNSPSLPEVVRTAAGLAQRSLAECRSSSKPGASGHKNRTARMPGSVI
jgi:protein subunit release factor B